MKTAEVRRQTMTGMAATKTLNFGPVQMLVVGFQDNTFRGHLLPELERLKEAGVVRIVDLLVVRKDRSGALQKLTATDLDWEEAVDFGMYIGTLIGFGAGGAEGAERGALAGAAELADGHLFTEKDAFKLSASVPDGTMAAVVLLEHIWALPLLRWIDELGGFEISNDWITLDDLVGVGLRQAASDES